MIILHFLNFSIRFLLYPVIRVLILLGNKKLKERFIFEKSFKDSSPGFKADFCFQVSSEGEFQQVRPIILKFLQKNLKIELLYTSESVKNEIEKLSSLFDNLRVLRFQVLSFNPLNYNYLSKLISASKMIIVRYDFFPELFTLKNTKYILVSGSLKNFGGKSKLEKWALSCMYKKFDLIIPASRNDKSLFESHNLPAVIEDSYDFRVKQIYDRQKLALDTLKTRHRVFQEYLKFIDRTPKSKRIILGSFWNDEDVFSEKLDELIKDDYHILVVPHKLSESNLTELYYLLKKYTDTPVFELSDTFDEAKILSIFEYAKDNPGVFILNTKGILCEIYTLFEHAYIAGGYRLSVHSLLEPYVAGNQIYSGPKVHRSTEYDLIMDNNPDQINLVEKKSEVIDNILNNLNKEYLKGNQSISKYIELFDSKLELF